MSVSSLGSLRVTSVAKTADTSNDVFFGKFSAISLWLSSVEKKVAKVMKVSHNSGCRSAPYSLFLMVAVCLIYGPYYNLDI